VGGQAAEQVIAGVVLSERLAVTMYGEVHRAQFGGGRNLRGLIVDPKMLEEGGFRSALTDANNIASATALDHPNIVPTVGVASAGSEVVVVTRGGGRYVTVQDVITSAKAGKPGGKLPMPVAALIGKSVIEALAAAHRAGVIHGAVHARSVLVDDEGSVKLGDFVVGCALTTAVAQGAESSLWRGLSGYIAPELIVGEAPTPSVDVFAVGALLYAMLSGEVPPGPLRATPAIERLVQRALDTDVKRRYRSASDLLENLLEAMEDDRWELADRGELIREAGLSRADSNIDEATEDLLASLGSPTGIQLQPLQPQPRAESPSGKGRLDAMLADLDDNSGLTAIDDPPAPFRHDPISDIIKSDARRKSALMSARVPSLDDPDDDEPAPAPRPARDSRRENAADEIAALQAIDDLDHRAPPVDGTVPPFGGAPVPVERAAKRAELPARAVPVLAPDDLPPPRLRSPLASAIGGLLVLGALGGAGYLVYTKYTADEANAEVARQKHQEADQKARELEAKLRAGQPDPGAIEIGADGAGVWLRLGRTPLDTTIKLPAGQAHDVVLIHDGNDATEAQVNGPSWSGAKDALRASVSVTLKPKGKKPDLPLQPSTPLLGTTGVTGAGVIHIESTPSDAEAWLFIGTNHVRFADLWAGRDYELAVVKPGFKTRHVEIKADDWRDGGDPNVPIDVAKKKPVIEKTVDLDPDPSAKLSPGGTGARPAAPPFGGAGPSKGR
jgi:serine/threonine protein kinase